MDCAIVVVMVVVWDSNAIDVLIPRGNDCDLLTEKQNNNRKKKNEKPSNQY